MRRLLAAALLILVASPLFAADEKRERQQLVSELLKLMEAPAFHRAVYSSMLNGFAPGNATDEQRERVRAEFDQVLGRIDFARFVQEVDVPLVIHHERASRPDRIPENDCRPEADENNAGK